MSYNKYYIYKEQISLDNGVTWQDTGQATPSGNPIGTYETLTECESETPPTPPSPYESQYFTITSVGYVNIKFHISSANTQYYYSRDSGETWVTGNSSTTIPVSSDKIMFKGNLTSVFTKGVGYFTATDSVEVEGNVMSLLYGDNFNGQKSLAGKGDVFDGLFSFNTNVLSARNLVLPADTLDEFCYNNMFMGCTSLWEAPTTLPATTLATNCYDGMFSGCTSLSSPPSLPAMTLADMCYGRMFTNCTALRRAPELPATTLAEGCYEAMFWGCTGLTTVPSVLPATALSPGCYLSMFYDCKSLASAPDLPAAILSPDCYRQMFYGCKSLKYIKCLATYISADNCTAYWVEKVSSTGTFVTPSSTNWSIGTLYGIPIGWTRVNA